MRYENNNGKTTISVANFTNMTMANLNSIVGRRIREYALFFESSLSSVVVVSVSFVETMAIASPLAPLIIGAASPLTPLTIEAASPLVPLIAGAASSLVLSVAFSVFSPSDRPSSLAIRVVTIDCTLSFGHVAVIVRGCAGKFCRVVVNFGVENPEAVVNIPSNAMVEKIRPMVTRFRGKNNILICHEILQRRCGLMIVSPPLLFLLLYDLD
mmetsp:Transcript_14569/g.31676  ORF Transcript_14569/g.31676 Transcript_14569/m.31676 type:complete len:212 (-) Transcript_14569:29-664(-)